MQRAPFIGAALAVTFGCAAFAQAQTPDQPTPSATPPPAAVGTANDASATQGGLRLGMVVKDPTGAVVGTISQIGETPDGTASVLLNVDGKPIGVLASKLTPSGDQAVISMTKAQVKASG
jgi:hypothetical protein